MHIWSIDGPREIELERDTDGLRESQSRSLHGGSSLRSAEGSHSGAELVLADTFEYEFTVVSQVHSLVVLLTEITWTAWMGCTGADCRCFGVGK